MEEITPQSQDENTESVKGWFQDNLRIIVSVAIVIVIAGGIYSYSKRSETSMLADSESEEGIILDDEESIEISDEGEEASTEEAGEIAGADTQIVEAVQVPESKETEGSFIETAARGNGSTHLARRALANHLEKSPDSSLTKEHKIYIEDYLRKNVSFQGVVIPGTSIEFSKDLINSAIEKSKSLNENQLKNLEKYSALVTSLT